MIYMIEVLLDHRLGYCFCMGVTQARVISQSVQARATGRGGMDFLAGIVVPPGNLRGTL